jgi:hypothetical protein
MAIRSGWSGPLAHRTSSALTTVIRPAAEAQAKVASLPTGVPPETRGALEIRYFPNVSSPRFHFVCAASALGGVPAGSERADDAGAGQITGEPHAIGPEIRDRRDPSAYTRAIRSRGRHARGRCRPMPVALRRPFRAPGLLLSRRCRPHVCSEREGLRQSDRVIAGCPHRPNPTLGRPASWQLPFLRTRTRRDASRPVHDPLVSPTTATRFVL